MGRRDFAQVGGLGWQIEWKTKIVGTSDERTNEYKRKGCAQTNGFVDLPPTMFG